MFMIGEDSFVLPEDFDTEEIDIFAELGVSNSHKVNLQNTQEVSDEFSILLEKEEIVEESLPSDLANNNDAAEKMPDSDTIAKILEVLVKNNLNQDDEQSLLQSIPGKAKFDPASTVVKLHDGECEISVLIDVEGSGPVRPSAKVNTTNQIVKIEPAPETIPSIWIPLYQALQKLLTDAINLLSSTKFTINKNL